MSDVILILRDLTNDLHRDIGTFEDDVKRAEEVNSLDLSHYKPVAQITLRAGTARYISREHNHVVSCKLANGQYRPINATGIMLADSEELLELGITRTEVKPET